MRLAAQKIPVGSPVAYCGASEPLHITGSPYGWSCVQPPLDSRTRAPGASNDESPYPSQPICNLYLQTIV
ncbi:unnamed protein product [Arctogadus glacialis]